MAPDLEWTYIPFDNARCGNGDTAGLAVNLNPDSRRVLIFMEGGGWCWNAENCRTDNTDVTTFTFTGVTETSVLDLITREKTGIFARDEQDNPFRDYSMVYIPYCTGDMHFGRQPVTSYGTAHVGALNMAAFVERIVPTFEDAEQVVLTGVSAGAYGALWNYDGVQAAFADTPVHLLSDSGPPLAPPALPRDLTSAFFASWNLTFPAACAQCSTLSELAAALPSVHPDRRFGFIGSRADWVLRRLFGRTEGGGSETSIDVDTYDAGLKALSDGALQSPNVKPFWVTSDDHVFIDKDLLDTQAQGTALSAWMAGFEAGGPGWSARIDDGDLSSFRPGTVGLEFPDPLDDETYAYPTDAAYDGQLDLQRVIVASNGDQLVLLVRTAELRTEDGLPNGFDHLALTIFFDRPDAAGSTVLPQLSAAAPDGFEWNLVHRLTGAVNAMHSNAGAGADTFGPPLPVQPTVAAAPGVQTVSITYSASALGFSSWEGVHVYLTTWDVDPTTDRYLPLAMTPDGATFGGGNPTDAKIMDDVGPAEIPPALQFADPEGDEAYAYPTSEGFAGAQDILGATVRTSSGSMTLDLQMRTVTELWDPPNGFDHVAFTFFISVPDQRGSTILPQLNGTMPLGLEWSTAVRTHGFGNEAFTAVDASAGSFGDRTSPAPRVAGSAGARSVSFSFSRDLLQTTDLTGAHVYVTTWDFDGIRSAYRDLLAVPGPFSYGGGTPNDPKLMDTLLIALP